MSGKAQDGQLQASIYRIEIGKTFHELSQVILGEGYSEQQLKDNLPEGYKFQLFHQRYTFTPKWKSFIEPVVEATQPILFTNNSAQQNYVLFIETKDTANIYAVTGGYGHNAVRKYIDDDFGLDVLSRFIKKEDKILKSSKERNFVGGIMGATKYFRNNFNLFENESFGKFYQELQAAVEKDFMVNTLGFTEDDLKKGAVCSAKSSFKINKAIDFTKLLKIVAACEDILKKDPIVSINDVKKLTKQKNEELIEALNDELFNQLWRTFHAPEDGFPFDLCHSDFENYLTAHNYRIKIHRQRSLSGTDKKKRQLVDYFEDYEFNTLTDIQDLFEKLKSDKDIKNQKHLSNQISALIICSYDADGKEITKDDFLSHLMGDVTYDGNKFFYIDKTWYQIKLSFIEDLNESCKNFLKGSPFKGDLKAWDTGSQKENDYNAAYIGERDVIVLDKITPDNIELCDILKWDENNLYIIHVKAEFGNTMRDLCAQISISANRLAQDLRTTPSKEFLKKAYQNLKNKKGKIGYFGLAGNQTDNITEDEFLKLFDKQKHFVLAVLDTASPERELQSMEDFNSSITKFSLDALAKEMAGMGQSLQIYQIKKDLLQKSAAA